MDSDPYKREEYEDYKSSEHSDLGDKIEIYEKSATHMGLDLTGGTKITSAFTKEDCSSQCLDEGSCLAYEFTDSKECFHFSTITNSFGSYKDAFIAKENHHSGIKQVLVLITEEN